MNFLKTVVVFAIFLFHGVNGQTTTASPVKMCAGFKTCLVGGHSSSSGFNYNSLRQKITNGCTHVLGSVVIQGLKPINGVNPDLSFLDTIQEINGCLIVNENTVPSISLKNLRIIRGYQSFEMVNKDGQRTRWAVYVSINHGMQKDAKGTPNYLPALKRLDMRSLKSIQNYGVLFESNPYLCYPQFTVNWKDIFEKETQNIVIEQPREVAFCKTNSSCSNECQVYDGRRYCWGPEKNMCQTLNRCTKRSCALSNRCFIHPKTKEEECCDNQCVAGCTGSTARDCLACSHFFNEGECVKNCPPATIYVPEKFDHVVNPKRRLALGSFCVKNCTNGFYEMGDSCVASCDKLNFFADGNKCKRCADQCPKSCIMKDLIVQARKKNPIIEEQPPFTPRSVLQLLKNCTIVKGDILVNSFSFNDIYNPKLTATESVRPEDLWNLKNIQDYTGRMTLMLENYPSVTNASFLSNLKVLRGVGFVLRSSHMRFLGMQNLKRVENNMLVIASNPKLCYMENFKKGLINVKARIVITKNKKEEDCRSEGKVCDAACEPDKGCRGPGPYLCGECRYLKAGQRCVRSCNEQPGYFYENKTVSGIKVCSKCHPECKEGCTQSGANHCVGGCRHYQDGPNCVATCPHETKFANMTTGLCEECPAACYSKTFGKKTVCTGPVAKPGLGGCDFCEYIVVLKGKKVDRCVKSCPIGFYMKLLGAGDIDPIYKNFTRVEATKVCHPCHPECAACSSGANYNCPKCRNVRHRDKCLPSCPADDTYNSIAIVAGGRSRRSTTAARAVVEVAAEVKETRCLQCHELCRKGCMGPSQTQCFSCKKVKIYLNEEKSMWSCNETCPETLRFEYSESNTGDSVCNVKSESVVANELRRRSIIISCVVLAVIIIIIVTIIIVCCVLRQRDVARKEQIRLKAKFSGALRDEEREPLNQEDGRPVVPPDQSHLRIIRDSELVRGLIIGTGAFGTVYRCEWKPPPDPNDTQKVSLDVAVKVLSDSTDPKLNAEFLEEARVMASLNNDFVMPLIGVCMTAQLQLVSLFQPHGSLLEYLRRYQATIKSKALLSWAVQIAKGMDYLESKKIIHRDLAARNVLVQDHNHVRITDFGLAKLMESEDAHFLATGGKMPVKWLALECIQKRIFTHKSDVWAFGITLWELFTFGQRPYSNMNAFQMCEFLQQGERLPQPDICTLDIYMLIIKCWMLDPESRPNFKELVDELARMRHDPPRYLVIQGDDARQHNASCSSGSGSGGNHQTLQTRPWRSSLASEEDKGSACSGASYASPSAGSLDGLRGMLSSGAHEVSCRPRHMTAATAARERERAKARYAEDPLSTSSPPRSTSAEDDYLEPHGAAPLPSGQPWSAGYMNTTPFEMSPSRLHEEPPPPAFTFSTFRPPDASNPEYMNPSTSDYLTPASFETPSSYYNEDVFAPPPPPPPPQVGYQNLASTGAIIREDTSTM